MNLRNCVCIVLVMFGVQTIGSQKVEHGIQSNKPFWIQNRPTEVFYNDKDSHHHQNHQQQLSTQYNPSQHNSQYPPQYTPQYPSDYTPPFPTQSKPQNPLQNQVVNPSYNQILYPPLKPSPTLSSSVVDQFNHRFPDGSYEFRYELPDETVRYERGYFVLFNHKKILVVRGYYSYRLPGQTYLTVFYTADQYGYRQDSSSISKHRPQLPRSLEERRSFPGEQKTNITGNTNVNQ